MSEKSQIILLLFKMVRIAGLEPAFSARVAPLGSDSG